MGGDDGISAGGLGGREVSRTRWRMGGAGDVTADGMGVDTGRVG